MDHSKKILILHGSAGYGHQKAAEALAGALRELEPGASVDVRDALDFFPLWLKKAYVGIYLYLIHRHPRLWGMNYAFFDARSIAPIIDLARRCFNGLFGSRLARLLVDEEPDVVFCTHFLSAEIIADLKRRKKCRSRAVTVITDFLVHRFWVFKETDLFAVALEKTKDALTGMGIDPQRVAVTGIPIDAKFLRKTPRNDAARKLGLDPGRFIVLLTSGGAGSGPMGKALASILRAHDTVQVAAVAGKNEAFRMEAEAIARTDPRVRVWGFVDNMDEFMDASDVIVGKGGGLTLSEALAKQKIFFVLYPVPGQEANNAACLEAVGAALWIHSLDELERRIAELAGDPELARRMHEAIVRVSKPHSARSVAEAGLKLLERSA